MDISAIQDLILLGFFGVIASGIIALVVDMFLMIRNSNERKEERRELIDMMKTAFTINTGIELTQKTEEVLKNNKTEK